MKSFKELIDLANAEIDSITTEDLAKEINENNVVVIDVQSKDAVEEAGMIP